MMFDGTTDWKSERELCSYRNC